MFTEDFYSPTQSISDKDFSWGCYKIVGNVQKCGLEKKTWKKITVSFIVYMATYKHH